jgi:hypothetical protein
MVNSMTTFERLLLVVVLALGLGACGGGGADADGGVDATADATGDAVAPDGGGDGASSAYPITPTTRLVSGVTFADPRGVGLAVNDLGTTAMAVWVAVRSEAASTDAVLYSLYSEGAWSAEGLVGLGDGFMYFPSVAWAPGAFMVAYERDGHYYARRFATASGAWEAETRLDAASSLWFGPVKVASDGTGFAAVWGQYDGTSTLTMVSRYDAGAWTVPVAVSVAGQNTSDHQIAGNASGYAVAWKQGPSIFAAVYGTGAWGAPEEIDFGAPSATPAASRPRLAAAASTFAVTWQQGSPTVSVYARVFSGGAWGSVTEIDGGTTSLPTAAPEIAASGTGYLVTWLEPATGPLGPTTVLYSTRYTGTTWIGHDRVDSGSWDPCRSHALASHGTGYVAAWIRGSSTAAGVAVANVFVGSWATATVLSSDTTPVGAPGVGGRGSAFVAAWPQASATSRPVYARRFASGAWGAEANLVTQRYLGEAGGPRLAADGAGGRLAVWDQYHDAVLLIFGSRFTAGAWDSPVVLAGDSAAGTYASSPRVAANGSGYAVAYKEGDDLYARIHDGTDWGAPALLELGTAAPQLALAGSLASNGTGYAVVWNQSDGVFANVYSGGAWGGATLLESMSGAGSRAVVASNGSGYAVAWHQSDGAVTRIYGAVHDGTAWGAAAPLEAGAGAATDARIASDGDGYAVVWVQHDGTVNSVYANVFAAGAWGGEALLETGAAAASAARVAGNAGGYLAAWVQGDGAEARVYAARHAAGAWGAALTLDAGGGGVSAPQAAATLGGFAVVWAQDDGTVTNVYANAYNGVWGTATLLESAAADVSAAHGLDLVATTTGYSAVWAQPDPTDTANASTRRVWAAGF